MRMKSLAKRVRIPEIVDRVKPSVGFVVSVSAYDKVMACFNVVVDSGTVVVPMADVIAGSAMQQSYNQIFPAPLTNNLH